MSNSLYEIVCSSICKQMDVLVLVTWLCVATAEFRSDLHNIETFIKGNGYLLKRRYRPMYHISAPLGWISDPAGFVYFKGKYHIFYQYHAYNSAWTPIHLGHVVSKNLVDWIHYPKALIPKEHYDKHGCLAGSAVVHNGYLTLFYTGNVVAHNRTYQTQNVAISGDGLIFQKYLYNPVIRSGPYGLQEFRNPKVWRFRHWWHMLVGSSKERHGQLLLYTSQDLFNWNFNATVAQSFGDMGYVWESPDFFELDGQHVLILSVQGIPADNNYRFTNRYRAGYVIGNINYFTGFFEDLEVSTATFKELDHGHDFYAAKTFQARDGRRLLIGWLGMWESNFEESRDGWASMLTLVREVKISKLGRILMSPVKELTDLRIEVLEDAWYSPGEAFLAGTKSFELIVNSTTSFSDAVLIFEWNGDRQYTLGYSLDRGYVAVDRGGPDGIRRADWIPGTHIHWRIFFDSSSIEIFCGEGEVVFSSRIYPRKSIRVRIGGDSQLYMVQYRLRRSVGYDKNLRRHLKDHFVTRYS